MYKGIRRRHVLRQEALGPSYEMAAEWLGLADIPRQPAVRCQDPAGHAEPHERPVQSIDRESRRVRQELRRGQPAIPAIVSAAVTIRPPTIHGIGANSTLCGAMRSRRGRLDVRLSVSGWVLDFLSQSRLHGREDGEELVQSG